MGAEKKWGGGVKKTQEAFSDCFLRSVMERQDSSQTLSSLYDINSTVFHNVSKAAVTAAGGFSGPYLNFKAAEWMCCQREPVLIQSENIAAALHFTSLHLFSFYYTK